MRIALLIFSALLAQFCYSQQSSNYSSKSIKAIAFFESALKLYNADNIDASLIELQKSISEDSSFVDAFMLQAEIYHKTLQSQKEITSYEKILTLNIENRAQILYYLAEEQYNSGLYKEANYNIQKCMQAKGLNPSMRNDARWLLSATKFAIAAIEKPVRFEPLNLGNKINSKYNDYWPAITADDKTMIFTVELPSRKPDVVGKYRLQEDLYIASKNEDESWGNLVELGEPVNTDENEGSQSISADGRFLFFTSCNRKGMGRCDLYYSERIGKAWAAPQNMGTPVNSSSWESQPCLAADGRTLYFASNRLGGKGGMDIWVTKLDDYGTWSKPENLGDSINTPKDEMSPFIHPDNQTLYFSSNGHLGMGKQDIFISRLTNGLWSKPVNIGYPINTFNDEYGLAVNAKGNKAYFASNRNEETKIDLYSFELPQEFKPLVVNYVKGVVFDSESKQSIKADFELSDLKTSIIVAKTKSIEGTGEYLVCLPVDRDYGLNISKDGYMFHSENFSLKGTGENIAPIALNIELQTIKEGGKEILKNIFYNIDSFALRPESKYELNKLVEFIKKNPSIFVEIGGHTDNEGDAEHNQTLSDMRAKGVYEYLITHGIDAARLTYKGYSYSQPIATNDSGKNRALNRRTEFKIVKIQK